MPRVSSAKNGLVMLGTSTPTMRVRLFLSARAMALGAYASSAAAASTRSRVSALTRRVPFSTCETVVYETPARAATCLIVLAAEGLRLATAAALLEVAGEEMSMQERGELTGGMRRRQTFARLRQGGVRGPDRIAGRARNDRSGTPASHLF